MKHFPRYRHVKTDLELFVIGATETSTGRKCFVCVEEKGSRERLFPIDGFDVPFVELEALYLTLLKREKARVKAQEKTARGKRRHIEARDTDEEDDALPSRDDELEPDISDQDNLETIDQEVLGDD